MSKRRESIGLWVPWRGLGLAATVMFEYLHRVGDTDSSEADEMDWERAEWLAQSKRRLLEVWDNEADDVYNELLGP